MADLKKNDWLLRNNNSVFSEKTLQTPGVLTNTNTVQLQFTATMDAFHKATREGFRLQDVNKAPLAQRRKQKKASDERSESTDSSQSNGSGKQGSQGALNSSGATTLTIPTQETSTTLVRNLSNNSNMSNASSTSHSSTHSYGFVPQRNTPVDFVSSQSASEMSSQDMFVIDSEHSSAPQALPFQEIRDSSDSDNSVENPPFQASRGVKRKHSLEEDYGDGFIDSDEYEDDKDDDYKVELDNNTDCIIIDDSDSLSESKSLSDTQSEGNVQRTARYRKKKPRNEAPSDTIVIDD